ncbi:RNA polymerase, sigma 28 subunit, SigD/FliA/WhiG [Actinokineospora globicatena]|nr:RNA polymerase, sigma 28 subunit, SigD/FliA/WhiG [Actinokineospora globicatena]GLW82302.1 RNA polymerase sigma factor [Actinokineospora globicatena]GLW89105.1 RNA polymerase sigma factor [Actinokineospora globicatena]
MTQPQPDMASDRADNSGYAHLNPVLEEFAALPPTSTRRAKLRSELVTAFLPLAQHVARRFANRGEPYDDLLQVATVGLINAIDRFDPTRGSDFMSFAVPTVMGEVRRHFRDTSWSMRVPRRLKELHLSLAGATAEMSQHLGRAPTPRELAERLDLPVEDVYAGLQASAVYRSRSLDEIIGVDESTGSVGDRIGVEDRGMADVEYHETLKPLLARLPDRERKILLLRFYGNQTQTQIADQVGLSQMHVSRLLAKTLSALRAAMTEDDD